MKIGLMIIFLNFCDLLSNFLFSQMDIHSSSPSYTPIDQAKRQKMAGSKKSLHIESILINNSLDKLLEKPRKLQVKNPFSKVFEIR